MANDQQRGQQKDDNRSGGTNRGQQGGMNQQGAMNEDRDTSQDS
jgi:hypothetical protein